MKAVNSHNWSNRFIQLFADPDYKVKAFKVRLASF